MLKNITPLGRSLIAFIISLTSYSYLARNFPDLDITFDYGFIRCVAGFYLGYLTYRLQHTSKRFYEHSSMGWIAILIALVFPLCMNKITVDKFDFVFPLLSFFLIFFVSMSARNSLIQKILGHGSLLWLGKRSYSLYMLSALVIWLINNTLRFLFKQPTITDIGGKTLVLLNPTVATLTLVATTALLLFFSDLAYRKIEKRFQYILNSYFFKSSPSLSD